MLLQQLDDVGLLGGRAAAADHGRALAGAQGASRAAPGKSGLHARGEGERVLALESREGTRASRRGRSGVDGCLSLFYLFRINNNK